MNMRCLKLNLENEIHIIYIIYSTIEILFSTLYSYYKIYDHHFVSLQKRETE